jgi:hypothetical protein
MMVAVTQQSVMTLTVSKHAVMNVTVMQHGVIDCDTNTARSDMTLTLNTVRCNDSDSSTSR